MTNTWWWVVVPPAEQNATSVPNDALIISTQEGSQFYNTLLNTDKGTVSVKGHSYVRYMGPFPSQQAAQQATPKPLTIGDWVGAAVGGAMIGAGGAGAEAALGVGGGVAGAFDALSGIAGALSAFYTAITDGKLWRSVGWLLLGIFLLGLGAFLMSGVQKDMPKVIPI
jgi:hypothetical protein